MDNEQLSPEVIRAAAEPFGGVPEYDLDARVAAVVDYSVRAGRRSRSVGVGAARTSPSKRVSPLNMFGIAALLLVGVIGVKYVPTKTPAAETKTFSTHPGQRLSVTLADGSHVTLAPATTLRVTSREVELNGEAIFTVTQKSENPFVVKAGNSVTRVLGTRFSVRRYTDDINTQVIVADGRVAVATESHPASVATLARGDMATVDQSGATSVTHDTAIDAALGWVDGWLVFRSRSTYEVAAELSRWYGATIRIDDPALRASVVSMVIRPQDTANSAIQALADAAGARIKSDGRAYTLFKSNNQ